jgi:glucose/arabinose dehydrogenase
MHQFLRVLMGACLLAAMTVPAPDATATVAPVPLAFDASRVQLTLTRVASGFFSPLYVTGAGDGTGRLFVVEQIGRIMVVKGGTVNATPFLDLRSKVSDGGERGLLGLAFHPQYRTNGRFFVDYTDTNGNTVIAEFDRSSTNADRASTTERVLLRIAQPYANHNGGMLAFGPDGYLYIGMGDGGSAGDPGNRAQSTASRLGKLLRIDVDHRSAGLQYTNPASNPYVGRSGLDEIWSIGLRSPWRFSFDRLTGDLWIGDVGQARYEEIDRATKASGLGRGANYGWRQLEGRACYNPPTGCSTAGKTMPVAVYNHDNGCAVIGGYVYRGARYPALVGGYLFGDECSGYIWALTANRPSVQSPHLLLKSGHNISSFGQADDGTLYLTDIGTGNLYRIGATFRS